MHIFHLLYLVPYGEWWSNLHFSWLSLLYASLACFSPFGHWVRVTSYFKNNELNIIIISADRNQWPLKKIMWLMVQIWFGNTYLSFSQAESFHKIFGPILMTTFAALSNTLLLTSKLVPQTYHQEYPMKPMIAVLISILSNTFARINEVSPFLD